MRDATVNITRPFQFGSIGKMSTWNFIWYYIPNIASVTVSKSWVMSRLISLLIRCNRFASSASPSLSLPPPALRPCRRSCHLWTHAPPYIS